MAVDLLVIRNSNAGNREILLIKRGNDPFQGSWALPGGFLDEQETLEEAAARELQEETGISVQPGDLVQLKAYSEPKRDPRTRVIGVAFSIVVPVETVAEADDDAADAKWFKIDELPELAFDHSTMIGESMNRLLANKLR